MYPLTGSRRLLGIGLLSLITLLLLALVQPARAETSVETIRLGIVNRGPVDVAVRADGTIFTANNLDDTVSEIPKSSDFPRTTHL